MTRACTWESHALDRMTLAFEVLAETSVLGGFTGAVEAFYDYEGAPSGW